MYTESMALTGYINIQIICKESSNWLSILPLVIPPLIAGGLVAAKKQH